MAFDDNDVDNVDFDDDGAVFFLSFTHSHSFSLLMLPNNMAL